MYAAADTRMTPARMYRSAVASSTEGSWGLWIRLQPHPGASPRAARSSCTASVMRGTERPAAPKKPRKPASAISVTRRTVAIPLAMAPLTYGNRTPWTWEKLRSPSHSGYSGGNEATSA